MRKGQLQESAVTTWQSGHAGDLAGVMLLVPELLYVRWKDFCSARAARYYRVPVSFNGVGDTGPGLSMF